MRTQLNARHHNDHEARQSGKLQKEKSGKHRKRQGQRYKSLQPRERKVKLNRTLWWVRGKHESINHKE